MKFNNTTFKLLAAVVALGASSPAIAACEVTQWGNVSTEQATSRYSPHSASDFATRFAIDASERGTSVGISLPAECRGTNWLHQQIMGRNGWGANTPWSSVSSILVPSRATYTPSASPNSGASSASVTPAPAPSGTGPGAEIDRVNINQDERLDALEQGGVGGADVSALQAEAAAQAGQLRELSSARTSLERQINTLKAKEYLTAADRALLDSLEATLAEKDMDIAQLVQRVESNRNRINAIVGVDGNSGLIGDLRDQHNRLNSDLYGSTDADGNRVGGILDQLKASAFNWWNWIIWVLFPLLLVVVLVFFRTPRREESGHEERPERYTFERDSQDGAAEAAPAAGPEGGQQG